MSSQLPSTIVSSDVMTGRCFLAATNEGKIQIFYCSATSLCLWLPRLLHFVGDDLWNKSSVAC
jgi:hypothetical protein